MQFIDHTGHQFTLPEYQNRPVGYEFDIDKYVFWLNSDTTTHKLAVHNAYIMPIRFLVENGNIESITIELQQNENNMPTYWLLGSNTIQTAIEHNTNIFDTLSIDNSSFVNVLNKSDLCEVPIDEKTSMCTFYIFGKATTENCILTRCLIHVKYDNTSELYCPITIGGEWRTEEDGLTINGQNMGIVLPKEILRAIYQSSFDFDYPDEVLFTKKLKEALMTYTHIKAECGNYESARDSLKWFGYGSHMNLSRLLRTDNQFISQYVHDNFDVKSDTLYSWHNFKNASLVSIWMNSNRELPYSINWPDFDAEFWGEGHPFTEDLMTKLKKVVYDEEDIFFWRPWYDWMENEMYLKMAAVAYYWKEYFLPISLCINSASIRRIDFANDIKYIVGASTSETATPAWIANSNARVKFPNTDIIYLYNQQHYMDECYNDFTDNQYLGNNTNKTIVYINDVCAHIPLIFTGADYYDVQLVFSGDNHILYKSHFQFAQSDNSKYDSFVIIPKSLVKNVEISYWVGKTYQLALQVNGNWYYYKFKLKVPQFQLSVGILQYKYFLSAENSNSMFTQVAKIHKETDPSKDIHNINNREGKEWIEFNSFMYVPQLTETNDVNFFDKLKASLENARSTTVTSSSSQTISVNDWLNYLASKCYIYNVGTTENHGTWKKGDKIVPVFMFNNGVDTIDIEKQGYKLKDFQVDVLFDVDANNIPYAKLTYHLNEINKMMQDNGCVECDQLKSYYTISDETLQIRKSEVTSLSPVLKNDNKSIDWEKTSIDWRAFYVDSYIAQKQNFTIRFVTTITLELPNGKTWVYGGYKTNGMPNLFKDILFEVWHRNTNSNVCKMDCNCILEKHCKFKTWKFGNKGEADKDSNYYKDGKYIIKEIPDDNANINKFSQIISVNTKKMIDALIEQQSYNIYINNNKRYLNRIHIFKLYLDKAPENNEFGFVANPMHELKYDVNKFDTIFYKDSCYEQPQALVDLYKIFFNDNGTTRINVPGNGWFKYDFYLVHDLDYWFVVFISQMTEDVALTDDDLKFQDKIIYENDGYKFRMVRWRSGDRFLINRMMYEESSPKNHFNQDDIIMMSIDNVKFPYILSQTTKWNIKPLSLKYANKNLEVQGKSNAAILSLPDSKSEYMPGYYDIDVRYSVDGIVDHQQKKQRRIFIK